MRFDPPARGGTIVASAVSPPYGVQVDLRAGTPVTFAQTMNGLAPTSDAQAPLGMQGAYVPIPCREPRPVYVAPQPAYVTPPPVVYAPVYSGRDDWRWREAEWRREEWRREEWRREQWRRHHHRDWDGHR